MGYKEYVDTVDGKIQAVRAELIKEELFWRNMAHVLKPRRGDSDLYKLSYQRCVTRANSYMNSLEILNRHFPI